MTTKQSIHTQDPFGNPFMPHPIKQETHVDNKLYEEVLMKNLKKHWLCFTALLQTRWVFSSSRAVITRCSFWATASLHSYCKVKHHPSGMTVSLKTVLELWAFLRAIVMSSETFNWARAATRGQRTAFLHCLLPVVLLCSAWLHSVDNMSMHTQTWAADWHQCSGLLSYMAKKIKHLNTK